MHENREVEEGWKTFLNSLTLEAEFITKKETADLKNNMCYRRTFLFVMPMTQT